MSSNIPQHSRSTAIPSSIPTLQNQLLFIVISAAILLGLFTLLRAALLLYNHTLIPSSADFGPYIEAFGNGLRFDLRATAWICAPLVLSLLSPSLISARAIQRLWLTCAASFSLLLGIIELDFYREFNQRLNSLVFQYMAEDPATVSSMLWYGFPVVRYLLAWVFGTWILFIAFRWAERFSRHKQSPDTPPPATGWLKRCTILLICLFISALAIRGTLRHGPPLRWGDAFTTNVTFANQLGLNGLLTLATAAQARFSENHSNVWKATLPEEEALATVRDMLLTTHDSLVDPETAAIRRIYTPTTETQLSIRNVVVILMESFAGRYTGALGHSGNITPHFDQLAHEGLLFTRFFSNGTHTHQGMFATMGCFPNLPGFEYLMQMPEGGHRFSGLPQLLKPRQYNDVYVYNGDFSWDNQSGFFSNQGMTTFIGRNDYHNPVFSDPTWGVSDQDMFNRSIEELQALSKQGKPFYALLQSLSNHTPYALPKDLPVDPVTGYGAYNEHLTAMRYSDWALGQFFEKIRHQPFYQDTLFVIVGDHGFGGTQQLTEINLLNFHVPLLLIAPGIQEKFGVTRTTVGTQIDIVPTIMGRLGQTVQHQCWGRDLLALPEDDPGFGMIKPSGSDQIVALVAGNQVIVQPKGISPRLYTYELGSQPGTTPLTNPAKEAELLQKLEAFIQTATQSLRQNTTGITENAQQH